MTDPSPGSTRRKRRGHSSRTPTTPTPSTASTARDNRPSPRGKVDPRTYAQIMGRIKAFVEARLAALVTPVARGFFNGCNKEEIARPDLQSAFFLFFTLDYRDQNGVRVLDMYRGYGFKPAPIEARVLEALEHTQLRLVEVTGRIEANRLLEVRDLFDGSTMRVSDQQAYQSLAVGDGIMAWFMPSSEIFRPIEVATHVRSALLGPTVTGLETLATEVGCPPAELTRRRAAQVFWAVYRGAQHFERRDSGSGSGE